ncbi:hypothetical protein KO494_05690 [Lacinutrix sp. C3R15]|uniref:hypothetical protein n=1 Tax=Flavobacteriaceae TaxID=49546 RepID=UPI001C090AC7|nr:MULTISPECIES: hypothetical protein [Flavobacteriaceae]MBU2939029.1 hypothetical protein [Lacinutrix sp. C3R15]MDO6622344.1 hypothetical protein [Oceanihabitans sp. 1_MG-2023]
MYIKLKRNDKIGLFFFLAFVLSTSLIWLFEERFNPEQWQSQPLTRYKMVDDIIESEILLGKTKNAVFLLLGEAIPSTLEGKEHLMYSLGKPPSFFEPKKERLVVVFENNLVVKVIHKQD